MIAISLWFFVSNKPSLCLFYFWKALGNGEHLLFLNRKVFNIILQLQYLLLNLQFNIFSIQEFQPRFHNFYCSFCLWLTSHVQPHAFRLSKPIYLFSQFYGTMFLWPYNHSLTNFLSNCHMYLLLSIPIRWIGCSMPSVEVTIGFLTHKCI